MKKVILSIHGYICEDENIQLYSVGIEENKQNIYSEFGFDNPQSAIEHVKQINKYIIEKIEYK